MDRTASVPQFQSFLYEPDRSNVGAVSSVSSTQTREPSYLLLTKEEHIVQQIVHVIQLLKEQTRAAVVCLGLPEYYSNAISSKDDSSPSDGEQVQEVATHVPALSLLEAVNVYLPEQLNGPGVVCCARHRPHPPGTCRLGLSCPGHEQKECPCHGRECVAVQVNGHAVRTIVERSLAQVSAQERAALLHAWQVLHVHVPPVSHDQSTGSMWTFYVHSNAHTRCSRKEPADFPNGRTPSLKIQLNAQCRSYNHTERLVRICGTPSSVTHKNTLVCGSMLARTYSRQVLQPIVPFDPETNQPRVPQRCLLDLIFCGIDPADVRPVKQKGKRTTEQADGSVFMWLRFGEGPVQYTPLKLVDHLS